jgi:hypothetical protein
LRYILTEYLHQVVGDNKSAIEELIIQTAERRLAVDQGFPDSAELRAMRPLLNDKNSRTNTRRT